MIAPEVFVPMIGDGNPFTAEALADSIDDSRIHHLAGLVRPLSWAHQLMTLHASSAYTEASERLRGGLLGNMMGNLMRYEVSQVHRAASNTAVFVQEFGIMGFSNVELTEMFPHGVFLAIPDVYPKMSALKAIQSKDIQVLVWNWDAFHLLHTQGVQAHCVKPFLVESFYDAANFNYQGVPVVVKPSGSGMPRPWLEKIRSGIEDFDYVIHNQKQKNAYARANTFFQSMGAHTRLLVSYPSEVVQEVASFYSMGWRGNYVSLPPRGGHEWRNFFYAMNHGLCRGILDVGNAAQIAEKHHVPLIKPNQLNEYYDFQSTTPAVADLLGIDLVGDVIRQLSVG